MAKRYTEVQKGFYDFSAQLERSQYRRAKRGLRSTWNPVKEVWWRKTPERWAWISKEPGKYLSFDQLKKETRMAGITRGREYFAEAKLHEDWPQAPSETHREDWISWLDFLGNRYLSLAELKEEVRKFEVLTIEEYKIQRKTEKGTRWPSAPDRFYRDRGEWISWKDLFGSKFLTLVELKKSVKSAGISRKSEYNTQYKLHKGWPSNPGRGKDWVSWNDLFGRSGYPRKAFLTLPQLKKVVKKEGVYREAAYKQVRKEQNWPSNPDRCYDEWISWHDLFGRKAA